MPRAPWSLWWFAMRPRTLTLSVVPVVTGSVLAWAETGILDGLVAGVAIGTAILIQVGTNLHNDVADFARGVDRPGRLGPARAVAEGWIPAARIRAVALIAFGLAVGSGVYLILHGGWPIAIAGVASIAAGWAYTGGPRPLGYLGLGECFVLLFFGVVAVVGSYYLQTGTVSLRAFQGGLVIGMPAAAVLVVNNYRDLNDDRRAGKRTLAVRFGRTFSRYEYGFLLVISLGLLPFVVPWPWVAVPLVLAMPAGWLIHRMVVMPVSPAFNRLLLRTAQYQLALGLLLWIAIYGYAA